ncbi:MAG: sigma 54-interacting transcriptional regulator [Bacteroidales bacterium]|nr:sigma 54-interacting transcriptional regulator [Bacteroidales bacterium]
MRNIFITWHYTTHGIAYLKHILSCFYEKNTTDASVFHDEKYEQDYCDSIFDNNIGNKKFDKIYYLTVKEEVIKKVSSRLHYHNLSYQNDEGLQQMNLVPIYDAIREHDDIKYNVDKELQWVKEHFPDRYADFKKFMWRDIQHYEIKEQIKWLKEKTNFFNVYGEKNFEVVEMDISDLRNERMIAMQLRKFFSHYIKPDDNCVIDISLSGPETQSIWHIMAANNLLPKQTQFVKTYDHKEETKKHFKSFSICTVSTKLIDDISTEFVVYPTTKSKKRELVNKKIEVFLKSGFSVFLLGERGTGKSSIISELASKKNISSKKPVEANCAAFTENNIAESELFGYEKGTFTGANPNGKKGLIEEAENGVLFLDEFHHISKLVQAKLMKAFQTSKDNNLTIRRVGGIEEITVKNVKLVFASNHTIDELHQDLLPDLYDRIVQYVVEIPPVRETLEDLQEDWNGIFERLYPKDNIEAPIDPKLFNWIKTLRLDGNFRDLQNIAKDYKIFYYDFDEDIRREICSEMKIPVSPFEYAKKCFEMYHANNKASEKIEIKIQDADAKTLEQDFHRQLRDWAIKKYGSRKEAAIKLDVSEKTLNNWK